MALEMFKLADIKIEDNWCKEAQLKVIRAAS
jgi:hypothetical protein